MATSPLHCQPTTWDAHKDSRLAVSWVCCVFVTILVIVRLGLGYLDPFQMAAVPFSFAFAASPKIRDNKRVFQIFCGSSSAYYAYLVVALVVRLELPNSSFGMVRSTPETQMPSAMYRAAFVPLLLFEIYLSLAGCDPAACVSGGLLFASGITALIAMNHRSDVGDTSEHYVAIIVYYLATWALIVFIAVTNDRLRIDAFIKARDWLQREEMLHAQRNQMISYIFHEVRNPINTICLATELAQDQLSRIPEASQLTEMVEAISFAAVSCSTVLDDALNIQRLQTGLFKFANKPMSLVDLHRQPFRMFQPKFQAKNIQCSLVIDDRLKDITVEGDFHRLKQVIVNFLSNAVKYAPENASVVLTGTLVHIQAGTARVRTSVHNTGSSIPESLRGRLFQPWTQVRAGDQLHGSGLGLSLSREFIVTGHNGRIDWICDSSGVEFFFEIDYPCLSSTQSQISHNDSRISVHKDRHASEGTPENTPEAPERKPIVRKHFDHVTVDVVVVEDSSITRKLISKTLDKIGVTFIMCENGLEAVQLLSPKADSVRCHLVLMDKEMPVMDGYQATRLLRSAGYTGAIYGLTGNFMQHQVDEFIDAGVDDVIPKPVNRQVIENILAKCLPGFGRQQSLIIEPKDLTPTPATPPAPAETSGSKVPVDHVPSLSRSISLNLPTLSKFANDSSRTHSMKFPSPPLPATIPNQDLL